MAKKQKNIHRILAVALLGIAILSLSSIALAQTECQAGCEQQSKSCDFTRPGNTCTDQYNVCVNSCTGRDPCEGMTGAELSKCQITNMKITTSQTLPGSAPGGFDELAAKAITIMLRLVVSLAIAVIVYGGFRMITSAGNDTTLKKGQGAFASALIGIVIVLFSYIIISFFQDLVTRSS